MPATTAEVHIGVAYARRTGGARMDGRFGDCTSTARVSARARGRAVPGAAGWRRTRRVAPDRRRAGRACAARVGKSMPVRGGARDVAGPTERLYLQDARRKTALATVTGHAAGGFLLDKTLFHAADAGYHHAQPCDLGHVLAEGHKLKLDKVFLDRGRLVHKTSGPLPAVGAKAQLHLDAPRRDQQARAHAAMHLLVTAVAESHGQFLSMPTVVGGGEVRLHARFREPPAAILPRVVARAQQLADAREPIATLWAPRDDAARMLTHEIMPLDAVAPGEPTLRLARTGSRSLLPCDAPLVDHTWEAGRLKLTLMQPRQEGIRFGVKAFEAEK